MSEVEIVEFIDAKKKYAKSKYGEYEVIVCVENMYVNATKLCSKKGKKFSHWAENNSSKKLVKKLPLPEIFKIVKTGGKNNEITGTYVHPLLLPKIIDWMLRDRNKTPEKIIQERLCKKLGGKMEVETKFGPIDILTDTELIEIKLYKNWKTAVGQVIIYGTEYPNHKKRIHLFDCTEKDMPDLKMISKELKKLGIKLTAKIDK